MCFRNVPAYLLQGPQKLTSKRDRTSSKRCRHHGWAICPVPRVESMNALLSQRPFPVQLHLLDQPPG